MTKPSEALKDALESLKTVLEKREEGTADYPRLVARVDTAYQRALDHAGGGSLPRDGERGGTPNPKDADERKVRTRVMRQAEIDARKIDELVIRLVSATHELRHLTDRHAETVGPDKQDEHTGLPGCRSCQRKETDSDGNTIGGHFAEVYAKSVGSGLCRDCWEFESAMDAIPPIHWCHLLHTQKKRAANRWLADNHPQLVAVAQKRATIRKLRVPKVCGHPTGKGNEPCARRFMHQGECLPAADLDRLALAVSPPC